MVLRLSSQGPGIYEVWKYENIQNSGWSKQSMDNYSNNKCMENVPTKVKMHSNFVMKISNIYLGYPTHPSAWTSFTASPSRGTPSLTWKLQNVFPLGIVTIIISTNNDIMILVRVQHGSTSRSIWFVSLGSSPEPTKWDQPSKIH